MTSEVVNISFVQFAFFTFDLSRICPEFVWYFLSNLICPEFVWNFFMSGLCPKFVQFDLFGICSEYVWNFYIWNLSRIFMFRICLEFFNVQNLSSFIVLNLSKIFYVWNLSSFIVQNLSRIFFMSGICCPEKIPDSKFVHFFRYFLDIFWIFWTISKHFGDIF